MVRSNRVLLPLLFLLAFALLPGLSLIGQGDAYLADAYSELPVKIFGFELFPRVNFFGGHISSISFPNSGPLNNADVLGTVVHLVLSPILGSAHAYNALVLLQLWLNMVAAWLLARDLTRDSRAALVAGVSFGLYPMVMAYCVAGAITDMLNLWPYPLAILFLMRALRRGTWGSAMAGGAFVGLGFVTCPYNAVVFSAFAVPFLLCLPFLMRSGWVPERDPMAHGRLGDWPLVIGAAVLGVALSAGIYMLWLRGLMGAEDSQMASSYVDATRHVAPYPSLTPQVEHRYTTFLMDYLAMGKDELIVREAGSRYYRAFSVAFSLLALGLLGFVSSWRRRFTVGFWFVVALFFALASAGPYLPVTEALSLNSPGNPVWLGLYHGLPGSGLILEPFRYALGVSLALGLTAAVGVRALQRRVGGWVGWVVPCVVVAEIALLSPVPVPLPTAKLQVDPAYAELDEYLAPGAIIELPYLAEGSGRFVRQHFANQLVHGRAIPNEVMGFLPRYFIGNNFLRAVVRAERLSATIEIDPPVPAMIAVDRDRLHQDGFSAIVVDPELFAGPEQLEAALALLDPLGQPLHLHGRLIYSLATSSD